MVDVERLLEQWKMASSIPELGNGGLFIAPYLVDFARQVRKGECIVETGPWIGSATAFLGIGAECGSRPVIHSYDQWLLNERWLGKAKKRNRLKLKGDEDLREIWKTNVKGVYSRIKGHKGQVLEAVAPDEPIGLFVDDCTHGYDNLSKLFSIFEPHFVDGCKIVMMDYGFVRTKGGIHKESVKYFRNRERSFGEPKYLCEGRSHSVMFEYKGG